MIRVTSPRKEARNEVAMVRFVKYSSLNFISHSPTPAGRKKDGKSKKKKIKVKHPSNEHGDSSEISALERYGSIV